MTHALMQDKITNMSFKEFNKIIVLFVVKHLKINKTTKVLLCVICLFLYKLERERKRETDREEREREREMHTYLQVFDLSGW